MVIIKKLQFKIDKTIKKTINNSKLIKVISMNISHNYNSYRELKILNESFDDSESGTKKK